jgi:3-hydroxybutyryl-CoA dehydrogenase
MSKGLVVFLASADDRTVSDEHLSFWAEQAEKAGYAWEILYLTSPRELPESMIASATVVVEWLPVKDGFKQEALQMLEPLLTQYALILSTSHEQMATEIAAWLKQPNRLIGFSPFGAYRKSTRVTMSAPMQLNDQSRGKVEWFWRDLEMAYTWIQDTPGMVLPRIYAMLVNEAAFALQEGVASAADIDTAMKLGTNYPMGPLAWADTVGIDVVLRILEHLWERYKEERYRPCLLLEKMRTAGHLGVSTGQGFHTYPPTQEPIDPLPKQEAQV